MHSLPGTYALVLSSPSARPIGIGKLGTLNVKPGFYVYVGSAFGPGGLKARLEHHREKSSRPHWHMDYIRRYMRFDAIWYSCDLAKREHQWVKILARTRGATVPLSGFGSSDCRCRSHLFFFKSRPSGKYFRRRIHASYDDHDRIFIKYLS